MTVARLQLQASINIYLTKSHRYQAHKPTDIASIATIQISEYKDWQLHATPRPATDLEDVERLELYVLALLFEHVHHELQVLLVADIASHDREVVSIQQQLSEQLHEENQSRITDTNM